METNIIAAQSLLERARNEQNTSIACMLIDSAHRLDKSIDAKKLKNEVLERWLQDNQNRSKS